MYGFTKHSAHTSLKLHVAVAMSFEKSIGPGTVSNLIKHSAHTSYKFHVVVVMYSVFYLQGSNALPCTR